MKVLITVFAAAFIVLIAVALSLDSKPPKPEPSTAEVIASWSCDKSANAFLGLMKEGSGLGASLLWKPGSQQKKLFAVHEYGQVTHGNFLHRNYTPYKTPRVYYMFDVQSSTHGGFPITKRWDVILEPSSKDLLGRPCPIIDLIEAE